MFTFSGAVWCGNFIAFSKLPKQIDENGKLLPNGIENLVNNVPSEYRADNLLSELNKLKPRLLEAKNACEAGEITDEILGDLFETELE